MGQFDEYPEPFRSLFDGIAKAGYADILLDERQGNRFLADAMVESANPTLREIGRKLGEGELSLGQLTDSSAYWAILEDGIMRFADLDPSRLEADLNAAMTGSDAAEADGGDDRDDADSTDGQRGRWGWGESWRPER